VKNKHTCRSAVGVADDERRLRRTELVEPGLLAALAGGEVPQSRSFLETEDTLKRL
jgi:hypothetical protein